MGPKVAKKLEPKHIL